MSKITRQKRKDNFTVVNNDILQNSKLSWAAKGMLVYLLHLPDNWQINVADLSNRSKNGRDGTAAIIKELMAVGYILRVKKKNEKSQFKGYDYTVTDEPVNGKAVNGLSEDGTSVNGKAEASKDYSYEELNEVSTNEESKIVELHSTVTLIDEVDETSVEIHHVPEYFNEPIFIQKDYNPDFKYPKFLQKNGLKLELYLENKENGYATYYDQNGTQHLLSWKEIEHLTSQQKTNPTPQVAPPPRPKAKRETTAEEMDLVYQVVTYLNEKTEQAFQPGGEKTKSLILARHHADKWGLEDFKTVIDHKKSEWFVKDNLRQYLRPSTLFAAGHAEEYLQAAKLWKKKPIATSPGVVPLFRQSDYNNVDKSKFKF